MFNCHNCGESGSIGKFIYLYRNDLWAEYRFAVFKETGEGNADKSIKMEIEETKPVDILNDVVDGKYPNNVFDLLTPINDLKDGHFAKEYVKNRGFNTKAMSLLYFAEDFNALARQVSKDLNEEKLSNIKVEPRLVIPMWTKDGIFKAVQGRSFENGVNVLRYITIKRYASDDKIYGEDRLVKNKPVFVVEGPLDSLFIPINCIATCDSNLTKTKYDNTIYIFDNQYRNKDICKKITKAIDDGCKVVLFPDNVVGKDINEMVQHHGHMQTLQIIVNNVYSGFKAKLKWANLRGI